MLLKAGADKVAINTYAVKNPSFLEEASKRFGSQAIVLSIEAKKIGGNKWEAFIDGGRERTGLNVIDWIKKGIELGVGEVLLTSVDMDGTEKGFDIDLAEEVSRISAVPFILSGGCGKLEHIIEAYKRVPVSAMAFASALHYDRFNIEEIKAYCRNNNIIVR
jgi:cyclase